jgi:DNA-binding NarL/FixJ family response regulator
LAEEGRLADKLRVIVADDHPLFRPGVVSSIETVRDMTVIGQAEDAASAVRLAREHLPDLALLDIAMPGTGMEAARTIAAVW